MKTKVNDLSAKDYSIGAYLKESKKFLIPRYQRSYAWEKKNIMQLLEDVSKEEGYYIGNIIVNTLQNDEKEIIDGQQRIISIFLILIALYHVTGKDTLKYVLENDCLKINIEKRIEDSGVSVMSSILDNNIASTMKKYNEVTRYQDICGRICPLPRRHDASGNDPYGNVFRRRTAIRACAWQPVCNGNGGHDSCYSDNQT